jgi:hypothetical protein
MADFATEAENLRTKASDRVFTLASGTLVLSVTFRNSIASAHSVFLIYLSVAWIALAVSVCSYILGLLTEAAVKIHLAEKLPSSGKLSLIQILLILIPVMLTWAGFATGIVFLAFFALMNNKA